MIDVHCHIIPGVDDGSQSLDESLAMADIAARSGVNILVATPHANQMGRFENFYSKELVDRFRELKYCIAREGIPLQLLLGMEIFASWDMDRKIRERKLIGLNGTRYYLVEWDFDEDPENIYQFLQMILKEGKVPLIAHPERYFCVQENPDLVRSWREMGCLAQINKGSIFGRFGSDSEQTANELLEEGLVYCLGSDAHGPRMRTPFMADGRDFLTDMYGDQIAEKLMRTNALKLLKDKPVL